MATEALRTRNSLGTGLFCLIAICGLLAWPAAASAQELAGMEMVSAGGVEISVPGYSVPSMADWDGDGLADLIVGEGSGALTPKIRIYRNEGVPSAPSFSSFEYARALDAGGTEIDLTVGGSGCMGLFPRVVNWNNDGLPDMLVGESYGYITIYTNIGTASQPKYDAGTRIQAGPADDKTTIDVGSRATPSMVDWDDDGLLDIVCGEYEGLINVFLNEGTPEQPSFATGVYAQAYTSNLDVSTGRSSPAVYDFNDDGKKDLLIGETNGYVRFYANTGLSSAPSFASYSFLRGEDGFIDLPGYARSRLSVCDWTGDGLPDLLIGGSADGVTGKVYLYQSVPEPACLTLLALGATASLRRRRRA